MMNVYTVFDADSEAPQVGFGMLPQIIDIPRA